MCCCSTLRAWLGLLMGLGLLLAPTAARAVDSTPAAFATVDHVNLKGDFYPGLKTKPTILLVPRVGGKRTEPGWVNLARALAAKQYAVLSFDWRGCGESTRVAREFWNDPRWGAINKAGIRGREKTRISSKDFRLTYYPWLVNDLAAAKHFLDDQNSAGACNSGDIVVIAAESGAALSALWIAAEWQQPPYAQSPLNPALVLPVVGGKPVGSDVAAAVWLTIPKSVRWSSHSVGSWLTTRLRVPGTPPLAAKLPMALIWGKEDKAGAKAAADLSRDLGHLKTGRNNVRFGTHPLAGKARGADLLSKGLGGVDGYIEEIINSAMAERGPTPWHSRTDVLVPLEPQLLRNFGARLQ